VVAVSLPLSFDMVCSTPVISAVDVRRITTPLRTPPCWSFTVPASDAVSPWALVGFGRCDRKAKARRTATRGRCPEVIFHHPLTVEASSLLRFKVDAAKAK
jgi:hypothetical protein